MPERLAQLLHLALPLAVQFAMLGWWRAAAWSLAITAFGSWGLADRWLAGGSDASRRSRGFVRAGYVAAGTIAGLLPVLLLLELFLRLLGDAPRS